MMQHPGVRTPDELTRGERAADRMKRILATWPALIGMCTFIAVWALYQRNSGFDPYPWILLNLCLSAFAGLQCFVLLIANKRGEQIAAEIAQHTLTNTETQKKLLQENLEITRLVKANTDELTEIHNKIRRLCPDIEPTEQPVKRTRARKPKG